MLMDLAALVEKYRMRVTGILHVGAHLAEEAGDYAKLGVPVWWVEANPDVIPKLQREIAKWPDQQLIVGLVTDVDGDIRDFHVTNYDGMSSSVFEFDRHPIYSPDTVFVAHAQLTTTTIDTLAAQHGIRSTTANMLCLDIQGAELLALRGAERFLADVDYVYTEVSTASVYAGGAQMHEIDAHLADFSRVETNLGMHGGTHGDALYVRMVADTRGA